METSECLACPWWFELDPRLKLCRGSGRVKVTVTKGPLLSGYSLLALGKDGT